MIYEWFKNIENRRKLSKIIQREIPEFIECDPNNHLHNRIEIVDYDPNCNVIRNSKDDILEYCFSAKCYNSYKRHFNLIIISGVNNQIHRNSYQNLLTIYENFDILKSDMNHIENWNWRNPKRNLATALREILLNVEREEKLKSILC